VVCQAQDSAVGLTLIVIAAECGEHSLIGAHRGTFQISRTVEPDDAACRAFGGHVSRGREIVPAARPTAAASESGQAYLAVKNRQGLMCLGG